ncbi:MAG: hypothetical protein HYY40_13710 [Bacteroidetes bacterium]|nr:hypothetical protein [Bacteroidota bacterium]
MEKLKDPGRFENIHIPLWLMKDTCWLLEWKVLGVFMIAPTLLVAVYIAVKTWHVNSFWINLAVCCWIVANSWWMICEFTGRDEFKFFSGIPFVTGLLFVGIFYRNPLLKMFSF